MAEYSGGLKIWVYGGSIAEPVSNALVTVFDDENAELYTVYTNPDGETEILPLAAPDPEFSEYPEGETPYFTYNAEIRADGYTPLRIEGIQIFPDVISLQPASLERGSGGEQLITVPAPALWGSYPEKIPEAETKTIPEDSGFVVLDSVVVPEFVVPCFRVVVITCYNLL
ncbi:MAG: carboxypeptidase regulatory-like domain-containing protein [Firmicutes bacterium]|nr:carboxypeptidase regulatory-like domain-containing protein [Bacillota bacterium]